MKARSYYSWDWLVVILLVMAIFTVSVRLDATGWTPDLGYVESTAVFGAILGAVLGISSFKISQVRWMVFLYSIFLLPLHLSRVVHGENTALGKLISLANRVYAVIVLLIGRKPIEDHIFFVVLMAALFWGIGLYCGYQLMRGGTVFSIIFPPTLFILIIQYYDGYKLERIWGLGFYFFLILMLVGRINLLNSRNRWAEVGVVVGSDPEFDLNKYIAVFAVIVIFSAWLLPVPTGVWPVAARTWKNITRPFESFQKRMDDVFAALESNKLSQNAGVLYAEKMSLGRTAAEGENELFRVVLPQNRRLREYWRARVYDVYQNGVWQLHASQNVNFDPAQGSYILPDISPAPVDEYIFSWQIGQTSTLVTPLLPVWVSRKGFVQEPLYADDTIDLFNWNVETPLQSGDQYTVRSVVSDPTQKALRESGNAYPEWMENRYLQVPAEIATEYKHLATQLTNGLPTNFDKVEAITSYLRNNISYSETIPAAPPGVDPMVWFLFGWKSGYCNYYASAEVMLIRSVGIPARMAVGYSTGKSLGAGLYSVRARDAHAWPEVYFPSIGWVQFEPTTNQTALIRPSGILSVDEENGMEHHLAEPGAGFRVDNGPGEIPSEGDIPTSPFFGVFWRRWLFGIIACMMLSVLGIVAWRMQKKQSFAQRAPRVIKHLYDLYHLNSPTWLNNWLRWSEVSPAERSFHAINQALGWLNHPQPGHVTPAERACLLKSLLPEACDDIDILSRSLEQSLFTPEKIDFSVAVQARRKLLLKLMKKIFRQWLRIKIAGTKI